MHEKTTALQQLLINILHHISNEQWHCIWIQVFVKGNSCDNILGEDNVAT